jgi:hypothetical protein
MRAMPKYRLYFLDLSSGRIKEHQDFLADDDNAAMIEAERLRSAAPMELWCNTRRVVKWPAIL